MRWQFLNRPAALFLCGAVAAGCGSKGAEYSHGPNPHHVREMLISELRRRARSHPPPTAATTRFFDRSSEAREGLIYHWGMYYPSDMPEASFSALVASRGETFLLLTTLEDWSAIADKFIPTSEREVLAACREMIHVTSQQRSPHLSPHLFIRPESLDSLPQAVPAREVLRRELTVPDIQADSDGWVVTLWAVERRNVHKYECSLTRHGAGLAKVDSLPGYGFY